jgi:2-polyprenyl-3-methyl-5-hydroxy-6-metoxy-1,4-benzoquinol methylase
MINKRFADDGIATISLTKGQLHALDKVREKLAKCTYENTEVDCPACGKSDATSVSEKDRYGLPLKLVCCKKCGLVRTNPRMTQESYDDFYKNHYRQLYGGKTHADDAFFNQQKKHGQQILDLIKKHVPTDHIKEVWEVGCGAGGILASFKDAGFKTKGCDLGEDYLQYGRNVAELALFNGGIINIPSTPAPDLIIYSHVLEHILDVNSELKEIRNKMAEGAFLYIEVPSIKNIHNSNFYQANLLRYIQNAHVYHFSLSTLERLLQSNGFEMIYGDEYTKAIFRKINLGSDQNHSGVNNEHDHTIAYLKRLELMRHFFNLKPAFLKIRLKYYKKKLFKIMSIS